MDTIFPLQRTTPADEVKDSLPTLSGDPTIIILGTVMLSFLHFFCTYIHTKRFNVISVLFQDHNFYNAEKFYVTMDQEVIFTCTSSVDALKGLIQGAFIFDTHYPSSLKFTFEYLERCKMFKFAFIILNLGII